MPRVFLLDPAYPDSVMPGFLRLAIERAGWDVDRPKFFLPEMDGAVWLADFLKGLAEAQILISLGDFGGLIQWGSRLSEPLAVLREKIDRGTPFVVSGASSLGNFYPAGASQMTDALGQNRDTLGSYGIHITPIKVAGFQQEVLTNNSSLCCVFHNVDDDLIDPQLFDGVDNFVAYGNRLIAYDGLCLCVRWHNRLWRCVRRHDRTKSEYKPLWVIRRDRFSPHADRVSALLCR